MAEPTDTDTVLAELEALEPIFHTPAFGTTPADFDRRMAPDYWEIGASGQRYDRAFILQHLAANPPVPADDAGWTLGDAAVRALGADDFLITYALDQAGRRTRRATLWRRSPAGWIILYHQGTIIAA